MAFTSWFALLLSLATLSPSVQAIPDLTALWPRQDSVTPLTPAEVAAFKPYTWYTSAAYCAPSSTKEWKCGQNCDANPAFRPIKSGGGGNFTQYWYVGYDPTLEEVIVARSSAAENIDSTIQVELNFSLGPLDPALFPGVPETVRVYQGVAGSHSKTGPDVLAAVKTGLSMYSTKKVTLVAHSLGAAVSLLDSVYLPLHLPSDVTVRYIGYGEPRVGNQAFADYVNAQPTSITRIHNKLDPIPLLPPPLFGYHHPSGEVHIRNDDVWVSCPQTNGQDNESDQCTYGAVLNNGTDFAQHPGPYDGVTIGC